MSDTRSSQEPTSLQKYEIARIDRSELKNAPYNPRKINDRQLGALKAILKKHGLVQPIIWNKRTGNIIGGHQRITAIDSIERTKKYALDVAVVDVDEREEVALNIALNNQSAMGEFDYVAVQNLSEEFNLDLASDLMFDRDDLLVTFGVDLGETMAPTAKSADADPELMQAIRDRKKVVREQFKATKEERGDYTVQKAIGVLTLVFRDKSQKEEFCASTGIPGDSETVHAEDVLDLGELPPPEPGEAVSVSIPMLPHELEMWQEYKRKTKASSDKLALLRIMEQAGIDPR